MDEGSSKQQSIRRGTVIAGAGAVIAALLVTTAGPALAGTGVGATFNLGRRNVVNAATTLAGATAAPLLVVDNDGAGPALDLRVGSATAPPEGKTVPPLRVDSRALVENLNADLLDGQDITAFATSANLPGADFATVDGAIPLPVNPEVSNPADLVSVTITAPTTGLVVLTGTGAYSLEHVTGSGTAARGLLTTTSRGAPYADSSIATVAAAAPSGRYQYPFSVTRTFPVTPGEHTFHLTAEIATTAPSTAYGYAIRPHLTAMFVPNRL